MNKLIEKLDKLLNDEIVFPDQLVRNMKIPGYEELKYTRIDGLLNAEFTFKNEYGGEVFFRYFFDEFDKLVKAEIDESGKITVIFNRSQEISNTQGALKKQLSGSQKAG
ncbi:MAG: hypothetical protein ACOYIF_07210 [Acetivibrionales bacterium]|jgi:hypothetical protein